MDFKYGYFFFFFGIVSVSIMFSSVKANLIVIEGDSDVFATNYSMEMSYVIDGSDATVTFFWSVNDTLVYGSLCVRSSLQCFEQTVLPNQFNVIGTASMGAEYVNTSINFRFAQPGPLSVVVVDAVSANISTPTAIVLKNCGPNTGGPSVTVDISGVGNNFMYDDTTSVSCDLGSSSVTLTCESNATWSQEGTCPETTTSTPAVITSSRTTAPTTKKTTEDPRHNGTGDSIKRNLVGGFAVAGTGASSVMYAGSTYMVKGFIRKDIPGRVEFGVGIVSLGAGFAGGITLLVRAAKLDTLWEGGDTAAAVIGYIGILVSLLIWMNLMKFFKCHGCRKTTKI